MYAIDPGTMLVTHRYLGAQIGPNGFKANLVRVLADGELALGGLPGVNGIGVWNLSTNALTVYNNSTHVLPFTLTGDRSLIVYANGGICTLDPRTGMSTCANLTNFSPNGAATPDGKSLLLPNYSAGQVGVFDAQTLTQTGAFDAKAAFSADTSMIVSPDSKTLYIGGGGGFIYAYDIASGAQIGWLPNLALPSLSGPSDNPHLQAFDNTGLLAGPM